MASWLAEKSEAICESLAAAAQELNSVESTPEVRQRLLNDLHGALYNATKIVEYAYDTELVAWTPFEAQKILDQGPDGVKAFMLRIKEYSDEQVFVPFPRTDA